MNGSIDSRLDFLSPVTLIPGLGAKRSLAFHQSGIDTIGDLLYHFPLRYVDRSTITPMARLWRGLDEVRTVIGTITKTRVEPGRKARLRIQLTDDSGVMEALWFQGVRFLRKALHTGMRVMCTGTVASFGGAAEAHAAMRVQMIHPALETIGKDAVRAEIPYLPRYGLSGAMIDAHVQQKVLFRAIRWALDNIQHYPQLLPPRIEKEKNFPPLSQCLRQMHMPADPAGLAPFNSRIVYEELYRLAVSLRWNKRKFALPGRPMRAGGLYGKFLGVLPFCLTAEQAGAIRVLHDDAQNPRRMHRLLQGDVGSGKTVVAFCACLPAFNEGLQAAWLAPTEALARQTFSVLSEWCARLDISVALLTGSMAPAEKRAVGRRCRDGGLRLVVGTHALLQSSIAFGHLGMVVIDEQHKFGAAQRKSLQEKDPRADFLLMSATPIPRSLAQTLYGDLDIVSIRGLPAGRLPVSTHCVGEARRDGMEKFIREKAVAENAQAYYVVPRIDKSDENDDAVKDAATVYDSLVSGTFSGVSCALIHGKTGAEEQERVMDGFKRGEIKLLVATTIVEVGIDAPGALFMVVENAERFGLSQLHQLRGRVGRCGSKSYCFLLANKTENGIAEKRLEYFCGHHDGFDIAEMDLRLRGPGEVVGLRQAGHDELIVADIIRDAGLFEEIMRSIGPDEAVATRAAEAQLNKI